MADPILGNKSRVKIATLEVANVRDESFSLKTAVENITTKDSLGWDEVLPTVHSADITLELLYEKKPGSPAKNYAVDLMNLQIAKTKAAIVFDFSDVTGDVRLTGNAYIIGFDVKTKNDTVNTVSVTIKPTGALTVTTV
jgi:hypothetical protein